MNWLVVGIVSLISSFFIYQNCAKDFSRSATFALNFTCDPFNGKEALIDKSSGLAATIYFSSGAKYTTVDEYLNQGIRSDTVAYFANVNVPTVTFDSGFMKSDGTYLTDNNKNKLMEWFALHYKTVITLPPNYPPGDYEFALISDDGSRLSVMINNQVTEIINNDGFHSTKVGCSNQKLNLNSSSRIPMEIKYFQGPRYDIANVLVWRRIDGPAGTDPLCGFMHRTEIFDYENGSAPVRFNEMLSRGWRIVPPEAFKLAGGDKNPCVK